MTSRVTCLAFLFLAACSRDAAIDVEFFSATPVTLTRLDVQLARPDGGTEARTFDGPSLPATLQVLASEARLEVTAVGFDADEKAYTGSGGTAVTPGPKNSLRVELMSAGWCPAPPPSSTSVVGFGEELAANWEQHGYAMDLADAPSACTGTKARRYQIDGQYDGFLFIAPTGIPARSVSMRLRVDVAQTIRVFVKQDDVMTSPTFTLPNPTACTDTNPWACTVDLVPGWQRVSVSVPANLPTLRNFQVQFLATARATVDIDDFRVEPRE